MITWRGWGLLVMVIGLVPFLFTVPMVLDIDPVAPGNAPPSLTGYFVFPLLVSAGLTFGLDRLLRRVRADRRHDFMSITVANWTYVFLFLALIIAIVWMFEKV